MDPLFLFEYRCMCGKLLLKGVLFEGTIEIKCKRCGKVNHIGNIKLTDDAMHYILIINNKGNVVNASDSALRILGFSHEELIGEHLAKINPNIPLEINKKLVHPESFLTEENYFRLDTIHKSKDGKDIPVNILLRSYKPTDKETHVLIMAKIKDVINEKTIRR